jgi:hypothetical protein
MKFHLKQLVFVTAFGTAIAAGAQSPEPSGTTGTTVPVIPDPNPAIMPSGGASTPANPGGASAPMTPGGASTPATQQDRVPTNRESDPIKACANVAAGDVDACIARESAKSGGNGTSKGSTSSSGKKTNQKASGAGSATASATTTDSSTGSMGSSAASPASGDAATRK